MSSIHGRQTGTLVSTAVDSSTVVDSNIPRRRVAEPHRIRRHGERLRLPGGVDFLPTADSFPLGTELMARPADDLAELLAGQRPVGAAIEIETSSAPRGAFDLTVPYDPALVADSGAQPSELVVVELDGDGSALRELRPHAVDVERGTLTVRAHGLSTFQPCTAGFTLLAPEVRFTATDEAVAYAGGEEIAVGGQVMDDEAVVALEGATAGTGWSSRGWFAFERVGVGTGDTPIRLRAERQGRPPYLCELVVRRSAPRKRVTRPLLYAAGDPAVSDAGDAYVATVLTETVGEVPVSFSGLRDLLAEMSRPYPNLMYFDVAADQWQRISLPPPRWIENEIARASIREIRRVMNLTVPIDNTVNESVRYLTALDRFLQTLQDSARVGASLVILSYVDYFSARHLAASPVTPCVPLSGDLLGVAYVLADAEGMVAALGNSVANGLERRHVPLKSDPNDRYRVQLSAGTLFFQEVDGERSGRRELVADHILCAGLSARRHPESGQPMILALAVPIEGSNASNRTELRLFQRQAPNQWRAETVSTALPIMDADLAVTADGTPWIVAAARPNPDDDLDGELYWLTRDGNGWQARELTWQLTGEESRSRRGMWPRVALDGEERPICAFSRLLDDRVVHMVATPGPGDVWTATQVLEATATNLSGVPAPALTNAFQPGAVGQSRAPYSHWAPAVSRHPEGGIYWAAGDGVLRLAEVDLQRQTQVLSRADVDRTTGFLPRFARRASGAPVLAFKDFWGAQTHVEGVDLPGAATIKWLDPGQGHVVPHRPEIPGPVPGRSHYTLSLADFAAAPGVTCQTLSSLIILLLFQPTVGRRAVRRLQINLFMGAVIDMRADAVAETVEITLRLDPGPATDERTPITSFTLRLTGDGEKSLVVMDAAGNPNGGACGIDQESWDDLADLFLDLDLDPRNLFPSNDDLEIQRVEMRGLRIDFGNEAAVGGQQGAISFQMTVPEMRAEGFHKDTGVDFTAEAVEPSTYGFTVAPHLIDGSVEWYVRSIAGRFGRVEVDTDTDFLTWVGVIGGLLTASPLVTSLIFVDPVLGTFATDLANEELARRNGPPFGGFATLLAELLAGYTQDQLDELEIPGEDAEIEAVFLESYGLNLFLRRPMPEELPPRSLPELVPSGALSFGAEVVDEGSAQRSVLVVNNGLLPAAIEALRLQSDDFAFETTPRTPFVVGVGDSVRVGLRFAPSGPPGGRTGRLEMAYNGGQLQTLDLLGEALPPPHPRLRYQPLAVQFGLVPVGQEGRRTVVLDNEGGAPAELGIQIQATAANAGVFRFGGIHPQVLGPGERGEVELIYRPTAASGVLQQANLQIDSNDPALPRIDIPLTGQAVAPQLLVQPDVVAFNDSPLADVLPPGLGSVRAFVIYNTGTDSLTLAASTFEVRESAGGPISSHYQLQDADDNPMPVADRVLAAGATLSVYALFRPLTAEDHPALVVVDAGPAGRVEVQISGRGVT